MNHTENFNTYQNDIFNIKCKVIDDIKSLIKELSDNDKENPCVVVEDIYGCDDIIYIYGYGYVMKKIYYNSVGNIFFIAENRCDGREKRFHLDTCMELEAAIMIYGILVYYKELKDKFA